MPTLAFCTETDVQEALQERDLSGPLASSNVQPAIEAVSQWWARQTNGHWYDSSTSSSLLASSSRTTTDVRLDIPSSPHRRDRQVYTDVQGYRYPTTHHGPYARLRLPHRYVTELSALDVRDRAGDVTDWVASTDYQSGRGEDYYLEQRGQDSYGQTALYVRAASIGPRIDYTGLLSVDYTYGVDQQSTDWSDVRRGIALAAAGQLVVEDDVLTAIPDDGQLVGVDTQRERLVDDASKHLDPYLHTAIA